jgi:hypothetical protein
LIRRENITAVAHVWRFKFVTRVGRKCLGKHSKKIRR